MHSLHELIVIEVQEVYNLTSQFIIIFKVLYLITVLLCFLRKLNFSKPVG